VTRIVTPQVTGIHAVGIAGSGLERDFELIGMGEVGTPAAVPDRADDNVQVRFSEGGPLPPGAMSLQNAHRRAI
jgi:hypothetical protein